MTLSKSYPGSIVLLQYAKEFVTTSGSKPAWYYGTAHMQHFPQARAASLSSGTILVPTSSEAALAPQEDCGNNTAP
jgi:hypothetical protein